MDQATAGELDEEEQRFAARLPAPPALGDVAMSHAWIIDWNESDARGCGSELQAWLDARRRGWARLMRCRSARDVLIAIHAARYFARSSGGRPILHFDARCDAHGLAPAGTGDAGTRLSWRVLVRPLQRLNIATRCNLVVVVTAARDAVAQALLAGAGDRIPCVAVVGPDADVADTQRLAGMKALHGHWLDGHPGFAPASRHMAPARVDSASMPALAHARLLRQLLCATRAGSREQIAQRHAALMAALGWADAAGNAAPTWPLLPRRLHKQWQSLFMVDLHPENRARFDFDARGAAWEVLRARGMA